MPLVQVKVAQGWFHIEYLHIRIFSLSGHDIANFFVGAQGVEFLNNSIYEIFPNDQIHKWLKVW